MRAILTILMMAFLVACTTNVPDDGVRASDDQTLVISDEVIATTVAATDPDATAETTVVAERAEESADISDTQDFAALTERETIESDKARLQAQKEKFVIIEPTDLPIRTASSGVSVVAYALATTNDVGVKIYKRFGLNGGVISRQACKKYRLADDAQLAFLQAGGPEKDRKSLDPDGDGFACTWSPVDYRNALN